MSQTGEGKFRTETLEEILQRGREQEEALNSIALALGRVVIAFNRLERDLGECLSKILGARITPTKDALNAALGLDQRIDVLAAVYRDSRRADNETRLLDHCVKELHRFQSLRNTLMHSSYGTARLGDAVFIRRKENVRGAKGLRVTRVDANPATIHEIEEDMNRFARTDLVQLYGVCAGNSTEWERPIAEVLAEKLGQSPRAPTAQDAYRR